MELDHRVQNQPFKLMIVDNAEENLRVLQIILQSNYEVFVARSANSCFAKIADVLPDLILLDVVLPEIDGYQVCRRLKSNARTKDIPVIFVSSAVTPEEQVRGYEAGGDEYVTKPFDVEDLLGKVQKSLTVRQEEIRIREAADEAREVAEQAMMSSSELGILNQFARQSGHAMSYEDLGHQLLKATRGLGLNASLALHTTQRSHFFGCTPDGLEARLLEKFRGEDRFVEFQARSVVNADNCSLLIKNMPFDDPTRYGRIKDHLVAIVDAADCRMLSLKLIAEMLERQSDAVKKLIEANDEQLEEIRSHISNREGQRRDIMMSMLVEVEEQLFGMGLDDDQEKALVSMLDSSVQKVDQLPDLNEEIEASFNQAKETLHQLLIR